MSFVRCGSRFLMKNRIMVCYLLRYGSRLKTKTENGVFLLRCNKRFSIKTVKRYGFWLRCRGFLSPNHGNGRSRNGTVRYGTIRSGWQIRTHYCIFSAKSSIKNTKIYRNSLEKRYSYRFKFWNGTVNANNFITKKGRFIITCI